MMVILGTEDYFKCVYGCMRLDFPEFFFFLKSVFRTPLTISVTDACYNNA